MGNVIASTEQMIEKINDVLNQKRNAIVNIANAKLNRKFLCYLNKILKM